MGWLVPILVAVITGPVVVILERLRKENTEQHAESRQLLDHVARSIDDVRDDLRDHRRDFVRHLNDHNKESYHHDAY